MSHDPESTAIHGLPENARRPLQKGEAYVPLVPQDGVPEVTPRSVILGLVFCAIFSMAAAYLALKLGQGIEAAIPISILAVGLSRFYSRRSTILENVITQSIGANSSHVVSGAVFTIPALYMLAAEPGSGVAYPTLLQVTLVSFLGGCLGILFLVPLRYYFMVENHGEFPWPEATATTEILVTGEKAGNQAKILAVAAGIGALYDGLVGLFRALAENIRLKHVWVGDQLDKQFLHFNFLNSAATLGIGYIIGLRYTAVMAAGSLFSMFVLVPLVHAIGSYLPADAILAPGTTAFVKMAPMQVFSAYVRIIGVGAIAGAAIMGVLASMPAMVRSIKNNLEGLKHQDTRSAAVVARPERSIALPMVGIGLVITILATFLFFTFGIGIQKAFVPALVGTLLVTVIAFFFAPVAARAIATIGTNPISGMTMLTLIITGFVMLKLGFHGGVGAFTTMMVGGVVCTALAASGAFSTDLKIGHWIGATPAKQIAWKFVGTLVAAVFCGIAMYVLSRPEGGGAGTAFGKSIAAPQAGAMKAILEGVFGTTSMPLRWYCFGLGVALSVVLRMVELPALGFALGMYLPIELNTPLFLGGLLSHWVNRPKAGTTEADAKERENRGVILASGLMAGGAIMGVLIAALKFKWENGFPVFSFMRELADGSEVKVNGLLSSMVDGPAAERLGILALVALSAYVVIYSRRAKASS
ncbi:MAG: oligopeptide transporter, OPT family [Holophaga sp.]|nr:oligopeptide transporter, OPT family [Holophaga sp.]